MGTIIDDIMLDDPNQRASALGVTKELYNDHGKARRWRDRVIHDIDYNLPNADKAIATVNAMYDLMIEIDTDMVGYHHD